MSDSKQSELSRRKVFAATGAAGALAAAAVALPLARRGAEPPPAPAAKADEAGGYQLTAHVLRYYETARV